MKIYCYDYFTQSGGVTAGNKAPKDICTILENNSAIPLCDRMTLSLKPTNIFFRGMRFLNRKYNIIRNAFIPSKNDLVVFQYPQVGEWYKLRALILKLRKCKSVAFVHDLDSIRYQQKDHQFQLSDDEKKTLGTFGFIICHNDHMKVLLTKYFDKDKLFSLGLFDYLYDQAATNKKANTFDRSIAYAGNLGEGKSVFLPKYMRKNKDKLHLYGPNFNFKQTGQGNYVYHGSVDSELLPCVIEGDFGLVWDGDSIETCSGLLGEYYRIICPHKCSLYIASGLPVIVWKESAISNLIKDEKIGIVVGSLEEAEKIVLNMDETEYLQMKKNVLKYRDKIIGGWHTLSALSEVVRCLR